MDQKFETVISGISGRFPDCDSIPEFRDKLYSGKSFMSLVPDRWPIDFRYQYSDIKIPSGTGKFKFIAEFDPVVFQINNAVAECTDAINRKILEPAFECVMDSGMNPYELSGKNVAVYMAYDHSDSDANSVTCAGEGRLWVLGSCRSMMSNRVSFALNLTGPSFTFSNDMFGNLSALNEAYLNVSEGRVEAAIVGIGAAVQHPMLAVNLTIMNLLSLDSVTRVFDKNANGYGRSDAIVCLFIQRADDAKRIYASIDFIGYTYFGSNSNSYYNFDEDLLKKSFQDICKLNKNESIDDISFAEMSACGIPKFDKTESNFIADIFCKNKHSPLLVGSVKSNVGMSDAASPYVSIIKALFALESGIIAQNIDLNNLDDRIRAFVENKLQVAIKPTPLTGDKILVNSVGMTGALSQVILKRNMSRRQKKLDTSDDLPRLILACSRTADGINSILKKFEEIHYDEEFISLTNDVFGKDMPFHIHRGYTILSANSTYERKSSSAIKGNKNRPVWFLFSGMGSQWNNMGDGLLRFPIIAETVKKCDQVLKKVGVDIYHILTTNDPTIFDNIMHSFVGIITIQIALVEVLKALGIKPDGIIGHSVGENGCAYADGCLTLEQAVLSSHARGMASIETKTIKGMMAAVGKGYNQIKDVLPEAIEVACHNSSTSCTLSGPKEDVEKYVQELQDQKIFAKAVNVANIAYHSKHIAPAAPNLLARLKQVIPNPVKRSPIWVSTSVAESDWDKPLAQYCSAEYLTNNLLNCVMFEEGSKHIPSDALVIEIAPHGLLQAIMKRSLPETCANVALTKKNTEGKNLQNLLTAIGELHLSGLEVNVNALYPPVEYPVSRDTSCISQLATWNNIAPDATRVYFFDLVGSHSGDPITIHVNEDSPYHYLMDHQINNRIVLPTSFFLYITWYVYSIMRNKDFNSHAIVFEDVILLENVTISVIKYRTFNIFIQKGSGTFEILKYSESNSKKKSTKIMTGTLRLCDENMNHVVDNTDVQNVNCSITNDQFYQLFRDVGYQLNNTFQSLEELKYNESDCYAKLKWKNNWVSFLDSILKFSMFSEMKNKTDLLYTRKIRKLEIAADQFSSLDNDTTLLCHKQINTRIITCNGLKMYTVENKHFSSNNQNTNVKYQGLRFVSHENPRCQNLAKFCKLCLQIVVENVSIMSKKSHSKLNVAAENNFKCFELLKNIAENCDSLKFKVQFHEPKRIFNKYITLNECYMIVLDNFNDIEKYAVDSIFFLVAVSGDENIPCKISNDFVEITKQQFTDEKFYLLKKKSTLDKKSIIIETEDWSATFNPKTKESEVSFIVKQNINSDDVSLMFANSRKHTDSRYLFVTDSEIPPQAALENQQIQDLPVSVLQHGEWGSYRDISEPKAELGQNPNSLDLPGDVQLESVHLQYLSCDKEFELHGQVSNYGIEYSGVEDGGERIMGLSLINSNDPISKPDPILKWKVPKKWTLEEAATVPFVYAQAYRILDVPVIRGRMHLDSILVNVGDEGVFCEACIAILLSRNFKVYISVANDEEATLIKKKFPQFDNDQIFNLQKQSYLVEVIKKTNGLGVNLVINCLQQIESVNECMGCLRDLGFFIQIGKPSGWENYELGLYSFLKALSFTLIPNKISSLLTVMSKDEKEKLKTVVEEGITKGVVVPFNRNVQIQGMPVNSENNDKFDQKTHVKNIFKWFLNNEMSHLANQKIRYDSNHSYIIVGGEKKNSAWFELVEWLISKGARKFIATVDNFFLRPNISHRINRLLNQKKATIILSSSQKMETHQDAESLVHEANRIAPLEAVFFMSVGSAGKKVHNMDLATRLLDPNIHLVSIFSGGLKECESRRFAGSPAVVIHGDKSSCKVSNILSQVDEILSHFDNSNSPTLYRIINTENKTAEFSLKDYLPHDIYTLEKISNDLINELNFVEVTTRSPRYSYVKDCTPVFVISALGPRPLQCLLSNLMSPAFCASIGTSNYSIEESALKLYESLTSIQSKGNISLVSETWTAPIAFELIKLLEQDNRKYKLFTLDGNPLIWKNRASHLGPINSTQFENNLIAQLLNIDPEIRLETLFGVDKPLPEKLSDYLCNSRSHYQSVNVFNIIKVLYSIRLGLEMVSKYEYKNQLLKNVVSIVRNSNGNESLNFSMTSESYVCNEDDYFKFLSSSQVYHMINDNVLYTLWYD